MYDPRTMSNKAQVMSKALSKTLAAVEGLGHKAVVIGAAAHEVRGSRVTSASVELLTSSSPEQRDSIIGGARGEGLQQSPDAPFRLVYTDAKLGESAIVDLVEASTPFHSKVISRAQRENILSTQMPVATCEDLILLETDPSAIVQLLRSNAARIDGAYLKSEAEAAGTFDKIKLAWKEAKEQG